MMIGFWAVFFFGHAIAGSVPKVIRSQDGAEMVFVPGGEFVMGTDDSYLDARPARKVAVKGFYIDKYEVTNTQYLKFVKATRHRPPVNSQDPTFDLWQKDSFPEEIAKQPVVNVSWEDAQAYCKWAGKRLPTEAEWEYAARGPKGFIYPWGQKFRSGRANVAGSLYKGPTIAGRYAKGVSRFGCLDMSGNVWEWTASRFSPYPGSQIQASETQNLYVVRGGSHKSQPYAATAIFRRGLPKDSAWEDVGFRCAR